MFGKKKVKDGNKFEPPPVVPFKEQKNYPKKLRTWVRKKLG